MSEREKLDLLDIANAEKARIHNLKQNLLLRTQRKQNVKQNLSLRI
jgi:hypothetical protein